MRFKKFLLVIPPFYSQNVAYWTVFPAGAGYILEYLDKQGIENDVIDMRLDQNEARLFKKIEEFKPDLIGFQILTYRYDVAFNIVKKVMERTGIKTVLGGPHMSSERLDAMRESGADFGVKGEGEITLFDLMRGKSLNEIDGLMISKENPDRKPYMKLDEIPFPKYSKFQLDKYDKLIPIVTSRGCPYDCTFCTVKLTMGKVFRSRSPENILNEIDYWYKKGYKKFHILDDNFTLLPDRVMELCDLLIARNYIGLDIGLPNGVRADKIQDMQLLYKMRKAGVTLLAIGVESANEHILTNIRKSESIEDIEKAIYKSVKTGFDVELFFTIGNQGETKETVEQSIKLAMKYPVSDVKFYNVVPFPNTELNRWIQENGKFREGFREALIHQEAYAGEPFFETRELSFDDRKRLLKRARDVRNEILKKNMIRKTGRVIATIFYFGPFNKMIKWLYSKPLSRRMLQGFVNIIGVKIKHI
ncbi:MAG: radical SAM protein [Candidatus Aenigmatarchaeota archaeon]